MCRQRESPMWKMKQLEGGEEAKLKLKRRTVNELMLLKSLKLEKTRSNEASAAAGHQLSTSYAQARERPAD